MVEVPDYNFLSADTVKPVTQTLGNWLDISKKTYDVRVRQAEQAQGQAYLNAIDPATGKFDANRFRTNLVAAGPTAALGASAAGKEGQTQEVTDYDLTMSRLGHFGSKAAQLLAEHPNGVPGDAATAVLDRSVQDGSMTPQDAARIKPMFGADAMANSRVILQYLHGNMAAQTSLQTARPGTSFQNAGEYQVPFQGASTSTPAYTGSPSQVPGGYKVSPTPGATTKSTVPVYGSDGKTIIRYQDVEQPQTQAMPGTSGTQPLPAAPALAAPASGPGSPGYTGRGPVKPPAAVTNPANPPPVTPPAPVTPAPATPPPASSNVVTTAPPMGAGATYDADLKLKSDALAGYGAQNDRMIAGQNAVEALQMAGNYTGPGTGTAAQLYAWFQARGGSGNGSDGKPYAPAQGTMSETAWREVLAKNLLRFAQDQGKASGTDLGLTTHLASNANADTILPNANRHIIIGDLGILRQKMAMAKAMPEPSVGGAVRDHTASYLTATDPRGFAWDITPQPQRDAIEAEVHRKGPAAEKALDRAIEDAVKYRLIPDPRDAPKKAAPAPPPPPRVPVTMNQPNALAAYA